MRNITIKMLRDAGACDDGIRKFRRTFPNGARVTLRNCQLVVDRGWDYEWLVDNLPISYTKNALFNDRETDATDELAVDTSEQWRQYILGLGEPNAWERYRRQTGPDIKIFNAKIARALFDALR